MAALHCHLAASCRSWTVGRLPRSLGVARTLLDRANTIVTDQQDKATEEKHIENALKQNNYPKWTIKTTRKAIQDKEKKTKTKKNE